MPIELYKTSVLPASKPSASKFPLLIFVGINILVGVVAIYFHVDMSPILF